MSGGVRARRQPSPAGRHSAPTSQRFPHPRHDHLDADERREAASRGLRPGRKSHATGGLNLSPGEWKLLVVILIVAAAVRLFRISQPNSVVYVCRSASAAGIRRLNMLQFRRSSLRQVCLQVHQVILLCGCSSPSCKTPDHTCWMAFRI